MSTSTTEAKILRAASKNDRRYITRHALGFYRALIIGGLYTFPQEAGSGIHADTELLDIADFNTYIPALKHCIAKHPVLSAGIRGQDGEEPVFVRPEELDVRRHLVILRADAVTGVGGGESDSEGKDGDDEIEALKCVMLQTHDQDFQEDIERIPPWKIVVFPLPPKEGLRRAYILFAYSHSHGDGRSGLNFHRTLLEGLRSGGRGFDSTPVYPTSELAALPPALEDACTLKITMGFLLFTLLGTFIPTWLRKWLGFKTPLASEETWTGKVMQYNAGNFRTGMEILLVQRDRVEVVMNICREKGGARFTGLLNQLIVKALSDVLPEHDASCAAEDFIGQIVVDLRAQVPAYNIDMMVNCASAVYEGSLRVGKVTSTVGLKDDEALWEATRGTTARLAHSARTLVDQPIGLVQYLDKFRPWFLEKVGQARDSSYEISNAVVFDPSFKDSATGVESDKSGAWDIERMVFSQPANVTSCLLHFSVVTRKDGEMVITANWQIGVLGVADENGFAKDVLTKIDGYLAEIAGIPR
ncbi:hypothetical protein BJX64DRAFT_220224 [Aspergillus heterothallicus]